MGLFYSKPASHVSKIYTPEFVAALPNMNGKTICITGTTAGSLGLVMTSCLLQKEATVICLNRWSESDDKGKAMLEAIGGPSPRLHLVYCDLGDFDSVRKAAKEVKDKVGANGLDVLMNNAGVMMLPDEKTKNGFEIQMQTNHLSHFLLTKELMPELELAALKKGESRIINHSSEARNTGKKTELDLKVKSFMKNTLKGELGDEMNGRVARYQQSKLANCVFTYALVDKLQAKGSKVKALVCHPGLSASNLQVVTSKSSMMFSMVLNNMMASGQSVEDGATYALKLICEDYPTGTFIGPVGGGWKTGPGKILEPEAHLTSTQNKDTLWKYSEEAIGEQFII